MGERQSYRARFLHSVKESPWLSIPRLLVVLLSGVVSSVGWLLGLSTGPALLVASIGTITAAGLVYRHGKEVWTTDTAKLSAELDDLRSRRASLEIVFARKHPMWWEEQKWYRIGVLNRGPAAADEVEVRLEEMTPNLLPFDVLPSLLGIKGSKTERCQINPGKTEYWDVVSQTDDGVALWTREGKGQEFHPTNDSDYQTRLLIRVTSANAEPLKASFLLRKEPHEPLQLSRLNGR
jgi:hypothetical protein